MPYQWASAGKAVCAGDEKAVCVGGREGDSPSLQPERTQGFAADPVYVKGEVFAYVGLPQNLKDLKGASRGPAGRLVRRGGG